MLIGIDEVGRGCWAGPLLVVAARMKAQLPEGLTDSKLLSAKRRRELHDLLVPVCDFGAGWVEADEIDALGLSQAMREAVKRALEGLMAKEDALIIMDGTVNYCPTNYSNVTCKARADISEPIVSAASIYAKVLRDTKMIELSKQYPGYGFEKHVGYGTKLHLEGLRQLGLTPLHRRSYKPVQQFIAV